MGMWPLLLRHLRSHKLQNHQAQGSTIKTFAPYHRVCSRGNIRSHYHRFFSRDIRSHYHRVCSRDICSYYHRVYNQQPPIPTHPTHTPPTMHPTHTPPTMYPTHTPPTSFPTVGSCKLKGEPCTKGSDCCKNKCNIKKQICKRSILLFYNNYDRLI